MKNGQPWLDVDGNYIQAHGGCILKHEGVFYWYGENKGENIGEWAEVYTNGVSCYSSKDLVNWKFEGNVLESDKDDPESVLYHEKVIERPKVVYNEKTKMFVMWMHLDHVHIRNKPHCGVAVSDSPTGKFQLLSSGKINGRESRDLTLYKDDDGKVYLFHSTDSNRTMGIAQLSDDYTKPTGMSISCMEGQLREAPAVCKWDNAYFMVTSGCTGWACNPALYSTSKSIAGNWFLYGNPCQGPNVEHTFDGQCSYIFKEQDKYYILIDHWVPGNLKMSGYSILPIEFHKEYYNLINTMSIKWQEDWDGIK